MFASCSISSGSYNDFCEENQLLVLHKFWQESEYRESATPSMCSTRPITDEFT